LEWLKRLQLLNIQLSKLDHASLRRALDEVMTPLGSTYDHRPAYGIGVEARVPACVCFPIVTDRDVRELTGAVGTYFATPLQSFTQHFAPRLLVSQGASCPVTRNDLKFPRPPIAPVPESLNFA
jgi:hypothetical protein